MITVLDIAKIGSESIYIDDPAARAVLFDHVLTGPEVDDRVIGIKLIEPYRIAVVAFRGSTTPEDFLHDLEAALPEHEGKCGWVPCGFWRGTEASYFAVMPLIPPGYRIIVTGHSLGAAQGADFAGYLIEQGRAPLACVLMGSPRPGRSDLNALLTQTELWSFRNGHDPVTMVPTWGDAPGNWMLLYEAPPENDEWGGLIGWHHWQLYLRGIARLSPMPSFGEG